jgi:predicted unusual protein kinase regulating ubiquinone biosynthesis (AarF/ABC1/UbiB family)
MNPDLADLLAALPATDDSEARGGALEALLVRLTNSRPPTSALRRFGVLVGLQAQVALAYGAWWVRGWFRDAGARQRDLLETHLRVAIKLFENMGYLRGAVMKVGQTLANLPAVVPDEIVDTLDRLHSQAPPMHFSLLREMVRNELGGDPEEVFAEFDTQPFAAASLGQVHRARLKSGEKVAVKIQYPSIAATLRADFRNLMTLLAPLRLSRDWENAKAQYADLERVLERETDYENEAAMLRKARSLFGEDDGIVVPRVFDNHSTRRVLAMEHLDGVHLPEFLAGNPSQELRDHFGRLLLRAWARMYYAGRMNYADLHPGNFFFRNDGTLGVIDFGCVRPFTDAEWELMRFGRQAMYGSGEIQRRYMVRICELDEQQQADPERMRLLEDLCNWTWRPLQTQGPFDFSDGQHLRAGVNIYREMIRRRCTRGHPLCVLIARMQFGYRSLLYRLRARVDCRAGDDEEVHAAGWEELR